MARNCKRSGRYRLAVLFISAVSLWRILSSALSTSSSWFSIRATFAEERSVVAVASLGDSSGSSNTTELFQIEPNLNESYANSGLPTTPAAQMVRGSVELLQDLFFIQRSTANDSIRNICDQLDDPKIMKEYNSRNDPSLIVRCLEALEEGQLKVLEDFDTSARRCTSRSSPILFHTFWTGPLPITAKLGLLSTIYNHPRDCILLHLWTTDSAQRDDYASELADFVQLQVNVVNGTKLRLDLQETHPSLTDILREREEFFRKLNMIPRVKLPAYSDALRFLLVGAHGGIYVDADVLVLQSFLPLLSESTPRDFYYRWSNTDSCNTAVLHMTKGSINAQKLLERALAKATKTKDLAKILHPFKIERHKEKLQLDTLEMLPSAYFDPSWVIHDGYEAGANWSNETYGVGTFHDFFSVPVIDSSRNQTKLWVRAFQPATLGIKDARTGPPWFFGGAFAFHWHNQWKIAIHPQSAGGMFLQDLDRRKLQWRD